MNIFQWLSPRPQQDIFSPTDDDWPKPADPSDGESDRRAAIKVMELGGVAVLGWTDRDSSLTEGEQRRAIAEALVELGAADARVGRFYRP